MIFDSLIPRRLLAPRMTPTQFPITCEWRWERRFGIQFPVRRKHGVGWDFWTYWAGFSLVGLLLIGFAWIGLLQPSTIAAEPTLPRSDVSEQVEYWIDQLGSDRYPARRIASAWLARAATSDETGWQSQPHVLRSLEGALAAQCLETRVQARRLIDQISQSRIDHQVARLLDPAVDASTVELPLWSEFSEIAGTDESARRFFAELLRRHQDAAQWVERRIMTALQRPLDEPLLMASSRLPYQTRQEDSYGWSLLLLVDALSNESLSDESLSDESKPNESLPIGVVDRSHSWRIMTALAHGTLGPSAVGFCDRNRSSAELSGDRIVQRIVGQWLRRKRDVGSRCDQIVVAMRYDCRDLAAQWSSQVLADNHSPPTYVATAILARVKLALPVDAEVSNTAQPGSVELDAQLRLRLHDDRVVHVWQAAADRRALLRTQVRDIALAALLFRHDIDPREAGFEYLQAHPTLVYRDYSLGFGNQQQRADAERASRSLLQRVGVSLD